MLKVTLLIVTALFSIHCGGNKEKSLADNDNIGILKELYIKTLNVANDRREILTGWLTPTDCDGFLWSVGKYASSPGVEGVNPRSSEYPGEPGRYNRRPMQLLDQAPCYPVGSPNTWSRDMGVGLITYAWEKQDLPLLEDHAAYANEHNAVMGEPLGDGQVTYTPALLGLLYQAIYALGGEDNPNRFWPGIYPAGLDEYEAHMQMLSIELRREISQSTGEAISLNDNTQLLEISDRMLERINEHAAREPDNPFYAYMQGQFTGDMTPAIDLCLRIDKPVGGYVRCATLEDCRLAEWIFACGKVLHVFNAI
jgi:hypothetical protein